MRFSRPFLPLALLVVTGTMVTYWHDLPARYQVGPKEQSGRTAQLRGTATYLERMAIPTDAELLVQVLRQNGEELQIVEEARVKAAGKQVPLGFSVSYPVQPAETYWVQAQIVVHAVKWFATLAPVKLDPNRQAEVQLILQRVQ